MRYRLPALLLLLAVHTGCGTTKWTDTARTATEQLLISDSIDRAVSRLDFRAVAGKKVFLDDSYVKNVTDTTYLVSSLRQQVLASGAILKEKREEADYVVEVRAGAVGTDHHDVLFGVPQTTIPSLVPLASTAGGATIPELPLVKKTDQKAVTKIAVFAYNRQTGRPIWQSGEIPAESTAKAVWVFGAGPFQRGNIYQGTKFAGDRFSIPLVDLSGRQGSDGPTVSVAEEAFFAEPREETKRATETQTANGQAKPQGGANPSPASPGKADSPSGVIQTSHNGPGTPAGTPAAAPADKSAGKSDAAPAGTAYLGDQRDDELVRGRAMPPDPRLAPAAWATEGLRAPAGPSGPSEPYLMVDPAPYYRR